MEPEHTRADYLSSGEGLAHGADGLGILVCLLLHLQQLCSLDQRLQGLLGSTDHQTFVSEPLLQLAHVVPVNTRTHQSINKYFLCPASPLSSSIT